MFKKMVQNCTNALLLAIERRGTETETETDTDTVLDVLVDSISLSKLDIQDRV